MTFAAFQAQFDATGPEKGDGYFPYHFDGMSADERALARGMLEQRALAGDTVDLDGLRLVGDDETAARLEAAAALDRRYGIRWEVARRETLVAIRNDPVPLQPLIERADDRDADVSKAAAQALGRHRLPHSFAAPLADRLVDGRHEQALLWLVKAWLSTMGEEIWQVPVFDANLPFIRAVMAQAPRRRAEMLRDREARTSDG